MKNEKKQLMILTLLIAISVMFVWCTKSNVENLDQKSPLYGTIESAENVQMTISKVVTVARVSLKWNQEEADIHSFVVSGFELLLLVIIARSFYKTAECTLQALCLVILDFIQKKDGKKADSDNFYSMLAII